MASSSSFSNHTQGQRSHLEQSLTAGISSNKDGIHEHQKSVEDELIAAIDSEEDDRFLRETDITSTATEISPEEKKRKWIRNSLISCLYILLWYTFSISLSVYNKWMFSEEGLNFKFPVLTTCGHQLVQFCLATATLFATGRLSQSDISKRQNEYEMLHSNSSINNNNNNNKDEDDDNDDITVIEGSGPKPQYKQSKWNWYKIYLISITPCAFASASDIGMGNVSFQFVTLTFYTMVKSSSLAWVLFFSILFKLEVPTRKLIGIIGVMTAGVVMMVAGEAHFVLVGFLLVLGAAVFSGLRWSLTQLLLRSDKPGRINTNHDPIRTIMYLTPIMFFFLAIFGAILEGFGPFFSAELWDKKGTLLGLLIVILPGVFAFLMTFFEFMLLGRTSVLTLSIAGICKEVITIISANLFFDDTMTLINFVGLLVTLGAIIAYNIYRYNSSN